MNRTVNEHVQPAPNPCLLLIDDDPLVRATLMLGMEDEGFRVVEADTGEAAITLLDAGLQPAVVVTDINLGEGCSGVDLANRLADSHPDLRVILISGRWRPPAEAFSGEERQFLGKPFAMAALARLVREQASSPCG